MRTVSSTPDQTLRLHARVGVQAVDEDVHSEVVDQERDQAEDRNPRRLVTAPAGGGSRV